jgi:hypothetical protein
VTTRGPKWMPFELLVVVLFILMFYSITRMVRDIDHCSLVVPCRLI